MEHNQTENAERINHLTNKINKLNNIIEDIKKTEPEWNIYEGNLGINILEKRISIIREDIEKLKPKLTPLQLAMKKYEELEKSIKRLSDEKDKYWNECRLRTGSQWAGLSEFTEEEQDRIQLYREQYSELLHTQNDMKVNELNIPKEVIINNKSYKMIRAHGKYKSPLAIVVGETNKFYKIIVCKDKIIKDFDGYSWTHDFIIPTYIDETKIEKIGKKHLRYVNIYEETEFNTYMD
jgi:hypothetical protein